MEMSPDTGSGLRAGTPLRGFGIGTMRGSVWGKNARLNRAGNHGGQSEGPLERRTLRTLTRTTKDEASSGDDERNANARWSLLQIQTATAAFVAERSVVLRRDVSDCGVPDPHPPNPLLSMRGEVGAPDCQACRNA